MTKDKRAFLRYRSEVDITVTVDGKAYSAKTVDYSLDGLCALFNDAPEIKVGDVVNLDVSRPKHKSSAKVMWASRADGALKAGLHRLGLLYGSLSNFNISDVLLGIRKGGKTGVFHVIHDPAHRNIYVKEGDMTFASSNQEAERFGDMLVSKGKLTTQQYAQAVEIMKKTGKRLGIVLVDIGNIQPDEMRLEVKNHVENIILRLFDLRDGEFMFKEGPLPSDESVELRLSAANLIYRGIKGITDVEHISSLCPPHNIVLALSSNPLDLFQDINVSGDDKQLLSLVDGKRTFGEIVAASEMNKFECVRSLCAFMGTRIIGELIGTDETQDDISPEDVMDEGTRGAGGGIIERIEHLYGKVTGLGHYGILEIDRNATPSEIKKAYYMKAKEFHPDRHYHLPNDMKDKLNSIFTHVTSAYSTLINAESRSKYDSGAEDESREKDPVKLAAQRFEEGREAYRQSRFSEAEKLFSEAAYLQGSIHNYHFHAGLAMTKGGKHKEAERAMQRALKGAPYNADYLAEVGHIFLALGFQLRARGNFEKALKERPDHKRALEGMSLLK
jgi:curved DNA-binding protein CbpA